MNWLNRILYRLSAYCRCRVISGPDEQPYLERYHLLRLPFGYRMYLHRFVASDPGRGLHNHPWRHAISLLLCGSYEETRMLTADSDHALQHRWLGTGHLNFISGDVYHRINIKPGSECWSLFLHAPKTRDWGFIRRRESLDESLYQYRDHNEVVSQSSNPLWWKQALRPIQCPQMRLPVKHLNKPHRGFKTGSSLDPLTDPVMHCCLRDNKFKLIVNNSRSESSTRTFKTLTISAAK